MKIPKEIEGSLVALQLARPVYMFEYGAHVKYQGEDYLAARPIMKQTEGPGGASDPHNPPQPVATDIILSALVVRVTDDMITVALFDPDPASREQLGNVMHKTLPSALVLSIDSVGQVDAPMPIGTVMRRAAPSKLIL